MVSRARAHPGSFAGRLVLAAALSAGVLSGSASVARAASGTPVSWVPGIPDSASLSSPAFIAGTVRNASGSPAAGADVALVAWPSEEVQAQLKVGDTVTLTPLAQTRSRADGTFTLRLRSLADVMPMESTSGNVDFEIVTVGEGDGVARYSFSSGVGANLSAVDPAQPSRANDVAKRGVDLRLGTPSSGNLPKAEPTAATDKDYPCPSGSTYYLPVRETLVATSNVYDLVGDAYNQKAGVVVKFTYSNNASSTLGVGYSATGGYGSWSQSGTATRSSTSSQSFLWLYAYQNNYWDTEFEYGEYRETCANSAGYYQDSYQVRPIEWIGGERERHPGTPNLTKCVWYPGGPGDVVSRTGTAAVNWSNGVDISGWLGSLSLSTQTGYSNSASITFDMNNASNITLCGRYDYPMGNNPGPGDILART